MNIREFLADIFLNEIIQGKEYNVHTNSIEELANTWELLLGSIIHKLNENPDIPLEFRSYGKTADEAKAEAVKYFKELRKLIRKQTAKYKKEMAKSAEQERAELLARLAKLEEDKL